MAHVGGRPFATTQKTLFEGNGLELWRAAPGAGEVGATMTTKTKAAPGWHPGTADKTTLRGKSTAVQRTKQAARCLLIVAAGFDAAIVAAIVFAVILGVAR